MDYWETAGQPAPTRVFGGAGWSPALGGRQQGMFLQTPSPPAHYNSYSCLRPVNTSPWELKHSIVPQVASGEIHMVVFYKIPDY